jgi:hypothetical protein
MPKTIDQLILNSPYEEPREHCRYHRETRLFTREPERRKAGYVRASESPRSFDDPGIFIELRLRDWPWAGTEELRSAGFQPRSQRFL